MNAGRLCACRVCSTAWRVGPLLKRHTLSVECFNSQIIDRIFEKTTRGLHKKKARLRCCLRWRLAGGRRRARGAVAVGLPSGALRSARALRVGGWSPSSPRAIGMFVLHRPRSCTSRRWPREAATSTWRGLAAHWLLAAALAVRDLPFSHGGRPQLLGVGGGGVRPSVEPCRAVTTAPTAARMP